MISIIIPNYNGEKLIKRNLPRLIPFLENYNYELIIVDDSSSDDSVGIIEEFVKKNKKVILIRNEKNLGFSPSVNKAVKAAKGEYLILLNNDVYPEKDFLAPALKDLKDDSVFAVGFKDESIENGKRVPRGRGVAQWTRGFLIHSAGFLDKKENLWASGGSSAFSKKIWNSLGGLNEIYAPFYWEDIDISYRALKAGFKVFFEKDSEVVHEHEKGAIRQKYTKEQIRTISFRNQFFFVWINASAGMLKLNLIWLPYHLIKALITFDLAFILGFLSFVIKFPRVLTDRQRVQKLFKLSDGEVTVSR